MEKTDPVCCGIEIAARRAIFVFLRLQGQEILDVTGKRTRITIKNEDDPGEIRRFYQAGHTLFEQMQPDRIAVIQRKTRGHFASGGITFKLEGLLQLYPRTDVTIVPPAALRRFAKDHRPVLTPRFSYQKNAYLMARYLLQEFLGKQAVV
jgi:hypothetical protein